MRSKTLADSSKARRHHLQFTPQATAAWHARVLREATLVRRLRRVARLGGAGVLGATRTLDALERGTITELLLTPRFVELNPGLALRAAQRATALGAPTTTITGLAALELDLAAGGIGAVLSRSCARSRGVQSVA